MYGLYGRTGFQRTETRRVTLNYCLIPPLCVPVNVDWNAMAEGSGHGHVNTTRGDGIPDGARSTHLHRYDQGLQIVSHTNLDDIPVPVSRSWGTTVFNSGNQSVSIRCSLRWSGG